MLFVWTTGSILSLKTRSLALRCTLELRNALSAFDVIYYDFHAAWCISVNESQYVVWVAASNL